MNPTAQTNVEDACQTENVELFEIRGIEFTARWNRIGSFYTKVTLSHPEIVQNITHVINWLFGAIGHDFYLSWGTSIFYSIYSHIYISEIISRDICQCLFKDVYKLHTCHLVRSFIHTSQFLYGTPQLLCHWWHHIAWQYPGF